ncbi:MAG: D-2-hydroxyacid dehydrogenase, partial [Alphaproteobacteria bacterium]
VEGATLDPGDNPWDRLAALGELVVHGHSAPEEIVSRAAGAAVVVTNKAPITAEVISALPDLRFVAVTATGVNVVDLAAARARGIPVSNVPVYGTDSVAQHTIGLLLELAIGIGEHAGAVRDGDWLRARDFSFWRRPLVEIAGLTLGIVGFGRIGRRVGELANAFGMRVLATPPRAGAGEAPAWPGFAWRDVGAIFREADVVSLHCALGPDNQRFVDRALLGTMKPTAWLLNTARGGLVDEEALAEALAAGTIAGAGLDVVSVEPMRADNPLLRAPRCIVTPHNAWATLAARKRLMETTVENVRAFLAGRPVNLVG